jgi:sulfofructose kinase
MPAMRTPPPGSAPFDVVGLGEISVDDVLLLEGTPAWGDKARVVRRDRIGGGQVATTMVALARLGLRTALLGVVGDDDDGRLAVEGLRAEGVDTHGIKVVGGRTRRATVVVDAEAARTVLFEEDRRTVMGQAQLHAEDVVAGRVLHVDGSARLASLAAAQLARERGVFVSCDLDVPHPLDDSLLPLVDLCVVPWSYAAPATGAAYGRGGGRSDAAAAGWRDLLHIPAVAPGGVVVVTRGEHGATVCPTARSGWIDMPAFAVEPRVDTTACGDTFRAGFLAALLDGRDLFACARFACAAAALKVRDLGRRGCPTRAAVEALLRAVP